MRDKDILKYAAYVAVIGAATYLLAKTYKSVKTLDNIDLDFGDDIVLTSVFRKER